MDSKTQGRIACRRAARALWTLAAGAALAASLAVGCAQDECGDPSMHLPDLSAPGSFDLAPRHDLAPDDGGSHD